jgi:autotransporter-associated beta strand protein
MAFHFTNPLANTHSEGTYITTSGLLRIDRGDQLGTGPVILQGSLQANGPLTINNDIYNYENGILDTQGHAVTIRNPIGSIVQFGSFSNMYKRGTGTLTLTAASPVNAQFEIFENQGTLRLAGNNGSLANIRSATLHAGTALQLDNSLSYNGNRLGDRTALIMNGGRFDYLAPSTATPAIAESVGTLEMNGFGNVVNITADSATTPTVLQFHSLQDNAGNITFRGNNLGGNTGNYTRILFESNPVAISGDYIPNAFFANTPGTGTSTQWAGYDFNRGIIPFNPVATSGTVIDNVNAPNTPITASFATLGNTTAFTGAQIFSLTLDNGSTLTLRSAYGPDRNNGFTPEGTLRIKGGYLESRNGAKTIQATTAQAVDFGTTYGVIRTNSSLTFTSDVALNGSRRTIKEGAATLTFNGPVNLIDGLLASEGTMILGSTATVGANVSLGATNTGIFNMNAPNQEWDLVSGQGGVINVNATGNTIPVAKLVKGSTLNVNENLTIEQGQGRILASESTINLANGRTLTVRGEIDSTIQGAGRLAVETIDLSANNTFSGGISTTSSFGAVRARHPNAFGTGVVNLSSHANASLVSYESDTLFGAIPNNIIWSTSSNQLHSMTLFNLGSQPMQINGLMSGGNATREMSIISMIPNVYVQLTNPNNSFVADNIVVSNTTLGITSDGVLGASSNRVRLFAVGTTSPSTLRFDANNITLQATRSLISDEQGQGSLAENRINTQGFTATIPGPLAGNTPLSKVGTGVLNLTGSSTHTGNFNLNEGTLLVNGSLAGASPLPQLVTAANTTLGGNGVIGSAANLRDVVASGKVAPGNSVGQLTVNGNVFLFSSSSLAIEIQNTGNPGTAYDSLIINGTLAINQSAVLAGDLLGNFQAPFLSAYTIVNTTGGILGRFANAPNDGDTFLFDGQVFQIRYNVGTFTVDGTNGLVTTSAGGNIVIAAVPEPTTWALLGLSAMGGGCYVWRKRRQQRLLAEESLEY